MDITELKRQAHDAAVSVWVGKNGVGAVTKELSEQLQSQDVVKVKFLRAARGGTSTETLASELAERTGAELLETRGNTAVYYR